MDPRLRESCLPLAMGCEFTQPRAHLLADPCINYSYLYQNTTFSSFLFKGYDINWSSCLGPSDFLESPRWLWHCHGVDDSRSAGFPCRSHCIFPCPPVGQETYHLACPDYLGDKFDNLCVVGRQVYLYFCSTKFGQLSEKHIYFHTGQNTASFLVFVLLGKATMYMAITAQYEMTFEMFPTAIRAQGGAWASSLANVSAFFAPYVPYSVSDWSEQTKDRWLKTDFSFIIVGHGVTRNAILHSLWILPDCINNYPFLAWDWG